MMGILIGFAGVIIVCWAAARRAAGYKPFSNDAVARRQAFSGWSGPMERVVATPGFNPFLQAISPGADGSPPDIAGLIRADISG